MASWTEARSKSTCWPLQGEYFSSEFSEWKMRHANARNAREWVESRSDFLAFNDRTNVYVKCAAILGTKIKEEEDWDCRWRDRGSCSSIKFARKRSIFTANAGILFQCFFFNFLLFSALATDRRGTSISTEHNFCASCFDWCNHNIYLTRFECPDKWPSKQTYIMFPYFFARSACPRHLTVGDCIIISSRPNCKIASQPSIWPVYLWICDSQATHSRHESLNRTNRSQSLACRTNSIWLIARPSPRSPNGVHHLIVMRHQHCVIPSKWADSQIIELFWLDPRL